MSDDVAGGYTKERRLRRSKQKRKVATPVLEGNSASSSGTETVDTETETIVGWKLGNSKSEEEVHNLDWFSELPQIEFSPSRRTRDLGERMSRKDKYDRDTREKESRDS